ncbi:MAG: hypothetical protein R6W91_01400 [Thermoplasmata archaeon]
MHEELRKFAIHQIVLIMLVTVSWVLLFGFYGFIVTILLFAVFYHSYKTESKRLDAGLPKTDERSLIVMGRARRITFPVMLFWFIGVLMYHELTDIPTPVAPRLDVTAAILSSIVVLMVAEFSAYYYYDKKGDF